jgi:hypothetical protein
MKWSLRIGRIIGIDVYVHLTFVLLLGLVGVAHWLNGRSLGAGLTGVLFFSGLFVCVLLHEHGHALAARRYGIVSEYLMVCAALERRRYRTPPKLSVPSVPPVIPRPVMGKLGLALGKSGPLG